MVRRPALAGMMAAATLAFAACGGSSSGSQAPGAAGACGAGSGGGGTAVSIQGFAFPASPIAIAKGGSVTFTNADSTTHTVTMDGGACDAGRIAPAASATITFTAAGTYAFHCAIHSSMKGSVVVS